MSERASLFDHGRGLPQDDQRPPAWVRDRMKGGTSFTLGVRP